MEYLPRMIDTLLQDYLDSFGAILIEGPKWCGKTTTGAHHAKSILQMQDPDRREAYLETAKIHPSNLLKGEYPRLIDEWQDAPAIWDAVRVAVDKTGDHGMFILTGSNSIDNSKILHSGTGRIARLKMFPMSLYESRESNGSVSLKELFDHPEKEIEGEPSSMTVNDLIFAACRGGWPAALSIKSDESKLLVARNYIESICETDISTVDGIDRNSRVAHAILREYARNISTLAKKSKMSENISSCLDGLSYNTFESYLQALIRLFIIEEIPAWSPAIRSSSSILKGNKIEFTDPSLAIAALELSPDDLRMDLKTFGFLFECLCFRDLKAYSQALHGNISYYHDRYGLEADAVLHLWGGKYALIEFKLGSSEIDSGASHLLEIKNLVKEYNKKEKQIKLREPDLLIVITGGEYAYTRPDGVHVVPLACLKD
jgi:predicted AAA+ superfamily ATPase